VLFFVSFCYFFEIFGWWQILWDDTSFFEQSADGVVISHVLGTYGMYSFKIFILGINIGDAGSKTLCIDEYRREEVGKWSL
jgi:hypothetical protein